MQQEFIIFCDESDKNGKHYSNFYGGLIINSKDYEKIRQEMSLFCNEINLHGEIKWSKVSEAYLEKYMFVVNKLFEYIQTGAIKIRIMFTHNIFIPENLTPEEKEEAYTRLYYQFLKHSFGLPFVPQECAPINLKIYIDDLPETKDRCDRFKSHLVSLSKTNSFKRVPINIRKENVTEIDSKKHIFLQLIDLVLGAMTFRLNDKHLEKPLGQFRRGKRTVAKEKLYKHILTNIKALEPQAIYKNFNIGLSTRDYPKENRWHLPYKHWIFVPSAHKVDTSRSKAKMKKAPAETTK